MHLFVHSFHFKNFLFKDLPLLSILTDAVVVLTPNKLIVLDLQKGRERWSKTLPNRCDIFINSMKKIRAQYNLWLRSLGRVIAFFPRPHISRSFEILDKFACKEKSCCTSQWIFWNLYARPWQVDFAVREVDFQITYPNGQAENSEQYQYLFTITSWFSFWQVKFGVTLPDGQVGVNYFFTAVTRWTTSTWWWTMRRWRWWAWPLTLTLPW